MTASQHREKVYRLLESLLQRKLTEYEHDRLRNVLISYIEHSRRTNPNIANHVYICQQCYDVKMGYGKKFKKIVHLWNNNKQELSQLIKRMEDPQ